MTAGNLIGMPDSRSYPSCLDPEAELTPEQSKELIQTASTASHSLTTLLVGVGAIGDLMSRQRLMITVGAHFRSKSKVTYEGHIE